MSHRGWTACGSAVGLALAASLAAPAQAQQRPRFREGEVIVKFARGTSVRTMGAAAASVHAGATVSKTMAAVGRPGVALVRFPQGVSVESMVAAFRGQRGVEYAEPNYIAYVPELGQAHSQVPADRTAVRTKNGRATIDPNQAINPVQAAKIDGVKAASLNNPNDPLVSQQGAWQWIGADVIWTDTVANGMIAVIDSGVDHMHPDLVGRVVKGGDWANNDADPMDDNGHGTHVAGIAAANTNNGVGVIGVAKSQIYAVKVMGVGGSGTFFDIASGIAQAANNPAVKILNLSLGGPCGSATLNAAMELAATKGKLIVVAMGNENTDVTDHSTCPAAYADPAFNTVTAPVTIAVGAGGLLVSSGLCPGPDCFSYIDYSCKADYSNYADWMTIVAPGTDIFATTPNRPFWMGQYQGIPATYAFLSGTSMATPMVAGSAARTLSAMPAGTTAAQLKNRIVTSGTPDLLFGQGEFVDTDEDGSVDTECWPTAPGFNANTPGVFVAYAMRRAEVDGYAFDANGALPLAGATITAFSGTAAKGTPGKVDEPFDAFYRVLNIPLNDTTPYDFAVNKPGYTKGNQKFTRFTIPDCGYVCTYDFNEQISVGVSSASRYNLVTDWAWSSREVDQYIYGPSAAALANCSVGYDGSCGTGELNVAPFMKWLHDGGPISGSGASEFSQIQTPLAAQGVGTPYEIFATDYCLNMPGEPCGASMYGYDGTFRLWKGGAILATVRAFDGDTTTHDCTLEGGAVGCDAWYIGDLSSAGAFTPRNVFGVFDTPGGDPDGVLPYRWRPSETTRGGTGRGPGVVPPRKRRTLPSN